MRILTYTLIILAVLAGCGYWGAQYYANHYADKKLRGLTERYAHVANVLYEGVKVNLLDRSATVDSISMFTPQGQSATVESLTVSDMDLKHGSKPRHMTMHLDRLSLQVNKGNFGDRFKDIKDLGYDTITADVDLTYTYQPDRKRLLVENLVVDARSIGRVETGFILSNFDPKQLLKREVETLVVEALDFEYTDRSLLKTLVVLAIQDEDDYVDMVTKLLEEEIEISRREGNPDEVISKTALVKYIKTPHTITTTVGLRHPLSIGHLAAMKKISEILDLFEIRFSSPAVAGMDPNMLPPGSTGDKKDFQKLWDYSPALVSTVYARNGEVIGYFYREKRYLIAIEDMSTQLVKSFLAAEDDSFYAHEGIDLPAIVRAFTKNIEAGDIVQGGSTITQQLIKRLILTTEKSYARKIKEAILAYRLERILTKDEILTLYLNEIFFGANAYGVEAAARTYFDKHAKDLTLAEAALLAGLPKAPSKYNPFRFPEAAKERQTYVLDRLLKLSWINKEEYDQALAQPLEYKSEEDITWTVAPYYVEEVRRWLMENLDEKLLMLRGKTLSRYGEDGVYEEGLHIYTAVDLEHQAAAEKALREGLEESSKRRGWQGSIRELAPEEYAAFLEERALEYESNATHSLQPGDRVMALVAQVSKQQAEVKVGNRTGVIGVGSMSWCREPNPKASPGSVTISDARKVLKPGDVVWASIKEIAEDGRSLRLDLEQKPKVQGALVSLDPRTGEVLALVGGYDYADSQFNRATQAMRQPGSAFKPIVYSAALDYGYTAASVVIDEPQVYMDPETMQTWEPKNYSGQYYGPTMLRTALVHSRNLVTVQVAESIGIENVAARAKAMGLTPDFPPYLSISLGAVAVSPINLCQAYTAFARDGTTVEPRLILSIENRDHEEIYRSKPQTRQAITPQNAYVISWLLKEVVQAGTGARARALNRPVAGKTGTTNDEKDAWFLGFSPYLLSGVYVGFDQVAPMGRGETGSRAALPIWLKYRQAVEENYPEEDFPNPGGIVFEEAFQPSEDDPLAMNSTVSFTLPFIEGTQPSVYTDLFHQFEGEGDDIPASEDELFKQFF